MNTDHDSTRSSRPTPWATGTAELPCTGEGTSEFAPVVAPGPTPGSALDRDDWLAPRSATSDLPADPDSRDIVGNTPPSSGGLTGTKSPRRVAGAVGLLAVGALAGA